MRNDTDARHAYIDRSYSSLVGRRESALSVYRIRLRFLVVSRGFVDGSERNRNSCFDSNAKNGERAFTVNSEPTKRHPPAGSCVMATKIVCPASHRSPFSSVQARSQESKRRTVARLSKKPTTKSARSSYYYYQYSSSPSSSFRSQAVLCSDGARVEREECTAYIAAPSSNASSLNHGGPVPLVSRGVGFSKDERQETDLRKKPEMVRKNIAST